eukprot:7535244-Lingulodinium_polyedra.AAC.1
MACLVPKEPSVPHAMLRTSGITPCFLGAGGCLVRFCLRAARHTHTAQDWHKTHLTSCSTQRLSTHTAQDWHKTHLTSRARTS